MSSAILACSATRSIQLCLHATSSARARCDQSVHARGQTQHMLTLELTGDLVGCSLGAIQTQGKAAVSAPQWLNCSCLALPCVVLRCTCYLSADRARGTSTADRYAQQSRGLFSQLVMDESFEFEQHKAHPPPCYPEKGSDCKNGNGIGWTQLLPAGTKATIALDSNRSMNGFHSMQVAVQSGIAGLANRGNGGSGLFIEASRSYEGYFFTAADASADVRVSLYNRDTNSSLGSTTVHIAPSTSFTQQNFTVSTTASAACTDVIRCAGEFRIEVVGRGRVNFDFVFLQPGSWGRYAGLPVLRSGAELLLQMGIKSIRVGNLLPCLSHHSAPFFVRSQPEQSLTKICRWVFRWAVAVV